MKIIKEKSVSHPLYTAKLENGVIINIYGEYAYGNDGKTYYHIGREDEDMLMTVGWSCETDKAVIIEE